MAVIVAVARLLKLETSTERSFVTYVEGHDCSSIKINKRSWPDRFTILTNGYGFYIEFKREGKVDKFGKRQGEKYQKHTHRKLKKKGHHVYLVDTLEQAKEIFHYELMESLRPSKVFKELKI